MYAVNQVVVIIMALVAAVSGSRVDQFDVMNFQFLSKLWLD